MPDASTTTHAARPAPEHDVLIVGCGFGGMGAAIALRRIGIESFLMLDRNADVGGTWHSNDYPGLAVDIPSAKYSYSFEPNPDWSRVFAPRDEINAYAKHVARKHELVSRMRFGVHVEQVIYDEASKLWTVHVKDAAPITTRVLILATGYLSRPLYPKIPGLETFAGKVIHTAAWDRNAALYGKRVAVIGTGATSVQLLPELAPQVAQLDVYQRTPIWVGPKPDQAVPRFLRELFRVAPLTQRIVRAFYAIVIEISTVFAILHHRQFPLITNRTEAVCRMHIRRAVKDPVLRDKLTPKYAFGCKRPTFSNTYYPTFARDNVELVTDAIARVEPDGIVTADGKKRTVDAIVLATGYSVWERDEFHSILGKRGVELRDHWDTGRYAAYEGITVPGFPNLFYLPAPYSYTGLSYFDTIEGQMEHIARLLAAMRRGAHTTFEVKPEACDAFVDRMRARMDDSTMVAQSCVGSNSYYFDKHGDPSLIRPTTTFASTYAHANFPLSDYVLE